MKTDSMDWVGLAGRVLMSVIFIYGGVMKALNPAGTMAYFSKLSLPMPGAAYALTLAVEIGVGILFLVGFRARITARLIHTAVPLRDLPLTTVMVVRGSGSVGAVGASSAVGSEHVGE